MASVDGFHGVCHGDELIYMWEPFYTGTLGGDTGIGPLSGEDLVVRDLLLSAWTNFASYGDPTPPNTGSAWLPQMPNSDHLFWYISSPEPTMSTTQEIQDRWTLWNDLFGYKTK